MRDKATEEQIAAFGAFRALPAGAWVMERLIVDNFVLGEIPTRFPTGDNQIGQPFTQFEQGLCEGRRQLAIEILDLFQMSIQDAYEAINRVDRMNREESADEPFAQS